MIKSKLGLALVICFWALVIAWYVRWQIREGRNAREGAIERQAIIERLLRPDWEFYERHLQRPAPAALREVFADRELIAACGLSYPKFGRISTFNALDEHSLQDTVGGIDVAILPLADSDCGDSIYLRPGATEAHMVYVSYLDEPKTEVFASSVAEMLKKLRAANRAAEQLSQAATLTAQFQLSAIPPRSLASIPDLAESPTPPPTRR